jgi:hypothetical protein
MLSLRKSVKSPVRNLSVNLSILVRLFMPFTVGLLIIFLFVSTMWFGGRRTSLAALTESELIRFTLRHIAYDASPSNQIKIVTINDDDAKLLQKAPHPLIRDVSIVEYAEALNKVLRSNPRLVVLSWNSLAHPISKEYLDPVLKVIRRYSAQKKVLIALQLSSTISVPEIIAEEFLVVEARDCYYEINSFCTMNPNWNWMPQKIVESFWIKDELWNPSNNLPHTLPNFLLNLPHEKSLTYVDFNELGSHFTSANESAAVFIGSRLKQEDFFSDNKEILQLTRATLSETSSSLMQDGMPLHVFWASMASMFIEGRTIKVVPKWLMWTLAISFAALTTFVIVKLGSFALGPFLAFSFCMVFLNVVSTRYFSVYLPIVTILTLVLVMFVAVTFASISRNEWLRWKFVAKNFEAKMTTDLKENFLSLLSHNLNTPIAKWWGILDILRLRLPVTLRPLAIFALKRVELLRLGVRVVLASTSLESRLDSNARSSGESIKQTIIDFLMRFEEEEGAILKRLGITLTKRKSFSEYVQGISTPLELKSLHLPSSLFFAVMYVAMTSKQSKITLEMASDSENTILISVDESSDDPANLQPLSDLSIDLRFLQRAIERYAETIQGLPLMSKDHNLKLYKDCAKVRLNLVHC